MTGDIQFRPYGDVNWYSFTGKEYKVKCNCGSSSTAGCTPYFQASDPPTYWCNNDSCTETCELVVSVTHTQANGGGLVATYNNGGDFRPRP